jgi:hypothetical protein
MTHKAGFDAVRGAAYFTRIPDAGNRFFGTHPRNADRIAGVKGCGGRAMSGDAARALTPRPGL